jgi:hypothetical protein
MKHFLNQAYDKLGIYHTPSKILNNETINRIPNTYSSSFQLQTTTPKTDRTYYYLFNRYGLR